MFFSISESIEKNGDGSSNSSFSKTRSRSIPHDDAVKNNMYLAISEFKYETKNFFSSNFSSVEFIMKAPVVQYLFFSKREHAISVLCCPSLNITNGG